MSNDPVPAEAAVLREAKAVLYDRGWHQGSLVSEDGSRCIVGAVEAGIDNVFCGGRNFYKEDRGGRFCAMRSRIWSHLSTLTGNRIPGWNDTEGRTFDEVIDLLDKAEWNFQEGLVE